MKKQSNFWLFSVVGMVAIVALVILISGTTKMPQIFSDDLSGHAILDTASGTSNADSTTTADMYPSDAGMATDPYQTIISTATDLYTTDTSEQTDSDNYQCDINKDGAITVIDALLLRQVQEGLIELEFSQELIEFCAGLFGFNDQLSASGGT